MNKPCVILFILLLVTASLLALSLAVKSCKATVVASVYHSRWAMVGNWDHGDLALVETLTPSAQNQSPSQLQATSAATTSQPSPFVVAAFIVGLVAVFGALFSLYSERRRGKHASRGRVVERFWAIDLYSVC